MNDVAKLLAECEDRGVRLEPSDDGGLAVDAPRGAVTPELAARLKVHKPEILAALWSRPGSPLFPPIILEALRAAQVRLVDDEQPDPLDPVSPDGWPVDSVAHDEAWPASDVPPVPSVATSDASARPTKAVCRCGGTTWRDIPIHGGQSVRRDCGRCGRYLDFPIWYGKGALQNVN
jgi:hypothetical protein